MNRAYIHTGNECKILCSLVGGSSQVNRKILEGGIDQLGSLENIGHLFNQMPGKGALACSTVPFEYKYPFMGIQQEIYKSTFCFSLVFR